MYDQYHFTGRTIPTTEMMQVFSSSKPFIVALIEPKAEMLQANLCKAYHADKEAFIKASERASAMDKPFDFIKESDNAFSSSPLSFGFLNYLDALLSLWKSSSDLFKAIPALKQYKNGKETTFVDEALEVLTLNSLLSVHNESWQLCTQFDNLARVLGYEDKSQSGKR